MRHDAKDTVIYNGEAITLGQAARLSGVPYQTLKVRYKTTGARTYEEIIKKPKRGRPRDKMGLNSDTYSKADLWVLYKFFAGQENELEMLSGFMSADRKTAARMLAELKGGV